MRSKYRFLASADGEPDHMRPCPGSVRLMLTPFRSEAHTHMTKRVLGAYTEFRNQEGREQHALAP